MPPKSDDKRTFYVVQFIELPFDGIDEYVCVPYRWLIEPKVTSAKAVVAYPKDEDPLETRDRVKRKERCNDEWRFYVANVKYKSNSYCDAKLWIDMRNNYGPLVEELKVRDTQPKLPVNKTNKSTKSNGNLRKPLPRISIKRPAQSELKKDFDKKRLKLDESAQSSSAVVNDAKVEPRYPIRKQPAIIQDNQSMEYSKTEESSVASDAHEITERRFKTPRTEQTEEALSSPVKDIVQRSEVIIIDDEDHSQHVKKPDHNNSISQANPSSNTSDVSMTAAKLEKQIDDHKLLVNKVPSQKLSTSYEGLDSLKMSVHLYKHMNGDRRIIPIQKTVEKTTKMERNLANNFLLNNPQLQASMSSQSTEDKNVVSTTSPQNIIASETSDRQNTERPGRPIYQPSCIQNITAHENEYQSLCTQELGRRVPCKKLVNQSTQTNLKTKRGNFMDDAARSPVTGTHLNVMDNACQTDECMVDETLSPYHSVSSDSDAFTDQEAISESEMTPNESPVETTNNINGTANDPGHGSADRPTTVPNSTSMNDQAHRKIILEQQMLDNFAALFTQMGSTLRHTTDMYNTLRSSILDTAVTYKKLLGVVEQFNTEGNAASNASPLINLRPKGQRSTEERHTKVTASASSSNQNQQSNDVANETPKKQHKKLYRFVLPPEYNANDTKWTLKYRTNLPGLVEIMPQSGVYVSYGDLVYCQHVSKDCKSLARRLLPAVFNRKALSVCSSMSETAQASNNVGSNIRPDLDDHASTVLLKFVIEHGLQRGWDTNLEPILSMVDRKIREIRIKHGVTVEC